VVATTSRLLIFIDLFCKRALWKRRYSARETFHLKEPTNRSHFISHTQQDQQKLHWVVAYELFPWMSHVKWVMNETELWMKHSAYGVATISRLLNHLRRGVGLIKFLENGSRPQPPTSLRKSCQTCVMSKVGYHVWGGYDKQTPQNYGCLLQNIVSFIGLFCKRDL